MFKNGSEMKSLMNKQWLRVYHQKSYHKGTYDGEIQIKENKSRRTVNIRKGDQRNEKEVVKFSIAVRSLNLCSKYVILSLKSGNKGDSFLKIFVYLFWLWRVLVVAHVTFNASCSIFYHSTRTLQLWGARLVVTASRLQSVGAQQLRCMNLITPWHEGSQFPSQGSNQCPLRCKANS